MADTPDTPTESSKPVPARRRAPRKAATTKPATTPKAKVRTAAKRVAAKTEQVAEQASAAVAKVERAATRTVKPRSSSRPKPASGTHRAAPARKKHAAAAETPRRGKWGFAAIAGGVAATGATIAALLSLRGSSRKPEPVERRPADLAEGKEPAHDKPAGEGERG